MRLALATCSNLPDWEVDDLPFHQAIVDAGIEMERPIWDDPAVDWKSFDLVLIRTTCGDFPCKISLRFRMNSRS